jgi:hypothetical protein
MDLSAFMALDLKLNPMHYELTSTVVKCILVDPKSYAL